MIAKTLIIEIDLAVTIFIRIQNAKETSDKLMPHPMNKAEQKII